MNAPKKKISVILLVLLWLAATTGTGYLFWQTLFNTGAGSLSVAELQRSSGVVSFRTGNSILWQTTKARQKFNVGDVISTSRFSKATIETAEGHLIELDANTMIRLDRDTMRRAAGNYELELLKGKVIARSNDVTVGKRAARGRLVIASGDKVVSLSEKPNSVIGLEAGNTAAGPEVFLSLGKNTISSVGDSSKMATVVIPALGKADLPSLPLAVSPDATKQIALTAPPKQKFDLPNVGISPELLAKLAGASGSASPSIPDASLPAIGVPVVKKSIKFTPLKKLESQKLDAKMPPVVVPKYPLPVVKLPKKSMIVTTQRLKDGCSLASFSVQAVVVPVPNTAPDWVPLLRIAFEGGDYREIADMPLPSSSGSHAVSIATQKICGIVGGKGGVGTITLTPGYQKEEGKILLRRSTEKTVQVISLHNRVTPINISFLPLSKTSVKAGGWLPFVPGKTGSKLTQVYLTPGIEKAVVDRVLGNSLITSIKEAKGLPAGAGMFFVKNNKIVMGMTGAGTADLNGRKMTKKLKAAFAFVGEADHFVVLKGPPINRLAKLETLTRQQDTVTLIARQRSFEVKSNDLKIGQIELLHMAASLSGAFKKRPGEIIFPQKSLAH